MIKITLSRKLKGTKLIKDFEYEYGSLENLKKLLEKDPENVLFQLNIDDWEYYLNHPENSIKEEQIIFTEDFNLEMFDLILMDCIKQEKPKSLGELSEMVQKEVKEVCPRLEGLEKVGFVMLDKGPGDVLIPLLRFETLTIEI